MKRKTKKRNKSNTSLIRVTGRLPFGCFEAFVEQRIEDLIDLQHLRGGRDGGWRQATGDSKTGEQAKLGRGRTELLLCFPWFIYSVGPS